MLTSLILGELQGPHAWVGLVLREFEGLVVEFQLEVLAKRLRVRSLGGQEQSRSVRVGEWVEMAGEKEMVGMILEEVSIGKLKE